MRKIREGRWDCSYCGKTNLARFETCQGCPASRGSDVAFYLPEGEPLISDAELLADATSGFDWHCDHCDSSNNGRETRCTQCGNLRTKEDKVHDASRDRTMGQGKPNVGRPPARPPRSRASSSSSRDTSSVGYGGVGHYAPREEIQTPSHSAVWGLMAALASVFLLLILSFTLDYEKTARVSDLSWSRTISIEKFMPIDDEGWSHPEDAYDITKKRKIRSYKDVVIGTETITKTVSKRVEVGTDKVPCGQESLGNGYFEDKTCTVGVYESINVPVEEEVDVVKEVPVYDTWYSYTVNRWKAVRTVKATGGDTEPYWPEVTLGAEERQGSKGQVYSYTLQIDEDQTSGFLSLPEWESLDEGDTLSVTINFWGHVKSMNSQISF